MIIEDNDLTVEEAFSDYAKAVFLHDDAQVTMTKIQFELRLKKDQADLDLRQRNRRAQLDLGELMEKEIIAGAKLREALLSQKAQFIGSNLLNASMELDAPTGVYTQ